LAEENSKMIKVVGYWMKSVAIPSDKSEK